MMKMRPNYRLVVAVLSILISQPATAQQATLVGTVKDKETQAGIPFCQIMVGGKNEGTYTDESGRFSLTTEWATGTTLSFSNIGYRPAERIISNPSTDSLRIELTKKYNTLKEVVVKPGKEKNVYIGYKKQKHVSDCYQKYGEEIALFLKADKRKNGWLKQVYVYITNEGKPDTKFRIHIYTMDSVTHKPFEDITDTNIIVQDSQGNEWVVADLSDKHIPMNDGAFVSVEWIEGHCNSAQVLQSTKHTEVSMLNGQVLGLSRNSWKGKRHIQYMFHRDAFQKEWGFSFNPIYRPMIYAKVSYYNP